MVGAPPQNNLDELWTLLNFIDPLAFASHAEFAAEFGQMQDESQVVRLQTLLRPYMLRRVKEDVAKHIPAKEETIIEVELTTVQKQYYRAVLERNTEFLYRGCKGHNVPKLLNVVMQVWRRRGVGLNEWSYVLDVDLCFLAHTFTVSLPSLHHTRPLSL